VLISLLLIKKLQLFYSQAAFVEEFVKKAVENKKIAIG